MSFNNDGQYDYKGKYDDGTKVILNIKKNHFINNVKHLKKMLPWDEC
jgi:hypothetical protein